MADKRLRLNGVVRIPQHAEPGPLGKPDYGIAAVDRTLDIVAALVRLGPATLSQLALATGSTRVTAFRILHTLQARGLVLQERPRGPWRLGAGWLEVARGAGSQQALARAAAPDMIRLAAATQETVYLFVRDGQESEVVAVHKGDPNVRVYMTVGHRAPLHAGPGRLLLAYAPAPLQRSVLATRLPRMTPATRTDPAWIAADLPRIRTRGWLITNEEVYEGAVSVSTGVRDRSGAVIAMLSIGSPTTRMRAPRPHTLLTPLIAAAETLGRALGLLTPGS
ncbi:MAG: IclR family transcriptional regulator [Acetobacteraceae bacterium]